MDINSAIARLRVIATNAMTVLLALAMVQGEVLNFLSDDVGLPLDAPAIEWTVRIGTLIALATVAIRRVSEVIPADRGLLPTAQAPRLAAYPPPAPEGRVTIGR